MLGDLWDHLKDKIAHRLRSKSELAGELDRLVRFSHDAIIRADRERRIVSWNDGATRLYGWTSAQALGAHTHTFFDTQAPIPNAEVDQLLTDYGVWQGELNHRTQTGARIIVDSRQVIIRSPSGRLLGFMEINRDLTRQKLTESELRTKNDRLGFVNAELRAANSDLSDFVYAASHDLQEPLRMISMYSEMLERQTRGLLSPEALESLVTIRESSQQMNALIRGILQYNKLTHGEPPMPWVVSSREAIEQAARNLQWKIDKHQGRVELEGFFPLVAVHYSHLVQLFQNLIQNALKYNEGPPVVRVGCVEKEGAAEFYISDNGIGIDPSFHQQIFGLFKRLNGQRYSGSGIGLSICQKLVDKYNGRIWVDSALGKGSTFYVRLPLAAGDVDATNPYDRSASETAAD